MPRHDQNCRVLVRPRLHLTLIGMGADGYLRNGGVGFSISHPHAEIAVSHSTAFDFKDTRRRCLQPNEILRVVHVTQQFSRYPVQVKISGEMPSHYGFGSATAIRLGVLEAINNLQSQSLTRDQLISASGRGGTSGIGVTTYFDGGLVFDVGVRSPEDDGFAPSSSVEGTRPRPLVLVRSRMPDWQVGVCIPGTLRPQTAEEEAAFFKRVCPIPPASVQQTLYDVIYGLLASALEEDLPTFGRAVRAIQDCAWKRNER